MVFKITISIFAFNTINIDKRFLPWVFGGQKVPEGHIEVFLTEKKYSSITAIVTLDT